MTTVKEAQAAQIRMEAGLSTLQDECAEQGNDWQEVLEQQARETAMRRELGLPVVGYKPGPQSVEPAEERAA